MKRFGMMRRILSLFLGAVSFSSQGAYAGKKRDDERTKLTRTKLARRTNKGNRNKDDVIEAIRDAKKKGHNVKVRRLRNGEVGIDIKDKKGNTTTYIVGGGLTVLTVLSLLGIGYWKYQKSENNKDQKEKKHEKDKVLDETAEKAAKEKNETELEDNEEEKLKGKQKELMDLLNVNREYVLEGGTEKFGKSEEWEKKVSSMSIEELDKWISRFSMIGEFDREIINNEKLGSLFCKGIGNVGSLIGQEGLDWDKIRKDVQDKNEEILRFNKFLLGCSFEIDDDSNGRPVVKNFLKFINGRSDLLGSVFFPFFGIDDVNKFGLPLRNMGFRGECEQDIFSYWSILLSDINMERVSVDKPTDNYRGAKYGSFEFERGRFGLTFIGGRQNSEMEYDCFEGKKFSASVLALAATYCHKMECGNIKEIGDGFDKPGEVLQEFQEWLDAKLSRFKREFGEKTAK